MYFVHPSDDISVNILTDSRHGVAECWPKCRSRYRWSVGQFVDRDVCTYRPICRPILDRYVGRYVDREWLSDCPPTCRSIGYRHSADSSLPDALEKEIFVPKYFWGATCLPFPSASYGPICICTAVIHLSTLLNKDWICGTWSEHKAVRNFWGWCITYTSVTDSLSFWLILWQSTDIPPTVGRYSPGNQWLTYRPSVGLISTEISADSQSSSVN